MHGEKPHQPYLEYFISAKVKEYIEKNYYEKIGKHAEIDNVIEDPEFFVDMESHIALYGDHGVAHVRNVAKLLIETLNIIDGVLIRKRTPYRLHFMKSLGVLMAYLHDIGMINFSKMGRKTHALYASKVVFSEEFDEYIDNIWEENFGNLSWLIMRLREKVPLRISNKTLLRECLSLVCTHSKSNFSASDFNDSRVLQKRMVEGLSHSLEYLYYRELAGKIQSKIDANEKGNDREALQLQLAGVQHHLAETKIECSMTAKNIERLYEDFERDAFHWLLEKGEEIDDFIDDVKDTLRTLRASDALRQRGAYSKTSAGYQMFMNSYNGKLIITMVNKEQQVYALESSRAVNVGEANIHSTKYTSKGDIHITFVTGLFKNDHAMERAIKATAPVVYDIFLDLNGAFELPEDYRSLEEIEKNRPMRLLIEHTSANLSFSLRVGEELCKIDPMMKKIIKYTTPLKRIPEEEKRRYLNSEPFIASENRRREIIEKLGERGYKTKNIDPEHAFEGVRISSLLSKEVLLTAGSPAGFVYLPLTEGLIGIPAGGFNGFTIPAYFIIGEASLLSGAPRNATIISDQIVEILIIPEENYMYHWYSAYTQEELAKVLKEKKAAQA